MKTPVTVFVLLSGATFAQAADEATEKVTFSKENIEFFEKDVLPILRSSCFKCHGAEPKLKGGFRITSREGVLKGGELGAAIDLKKPKESQLVDAINYGGLEMPPDAKLPAEKIATLTKWVELGAPWSSTKDYGVKEVTEEDTRGDGKDYWAYQPVTRPEAPTVRNKEWVASPIDAFLLAKIEAAGLSPAKAASKVALIRRAYYDLTGLPPSPAEVDAFLKDDSPKAFEKIVDRLLESPQYGAKWGRHWLDLVRYAETHGYERDSPKPFAWRFRDYAIDSFNADKPYDQFIIEQLAGDEVPNVTRETLTATGFYRLGIWDDEPADRLLARYDGLDDIVKTTGEVVLGMSLGCCRCHDHKGDPIDQDEYYGFLAYFHDVTHSNRDNLRNWVTDEDRAAHERSLVEKRNREGRLYAEIYDLEQRFLLGLKKEGLSTSGLGRSDLEDVRYRFYRDTWEALPKFDELKHEVEGSIASNLFSLKPASRLEAIGLVYEAKLNVPADGEYTFIINSTEGARLLVNNKLVVERDGKGNAKEDGKVTLKAGLLPIRLEYFNSYEKPRLTVSWSGPNFSTRFLSDDGGGGSGPVLAADSRKEPQKWKYVTDKPSDDWATLDFNDRGWPKGDGGFGRRGTPGSVVRTDWTKSDIWLRRNFPCNRIPEVLALDLHYDEDCEVYLNGVLVHSAKGYLQNYLRVPLGSKAIGALKKGKNILAVHCHQTGGGQYIDVGLVAASGEFDFASMLAQHGDRILGKGSVGKYRQLQKQLTDSRKAKTPPAGTPIMSVAESGHTPVHVLVRGNPHAPGKQVSPTIPAVLRIPVPEIPEARPAGGTSGKRLALAKWLVSKNNPLTARVFVNRLWQFHFGRGIVPTPNDFGKFGEAPTHPELLDWLAAEFMAGDWKIKRMHKLILMSNAWQMSSQSNDAAMLKDPGNNLLWRANMRRLSAEEIRDSILAATGELNLKLGGPHIYVPIAQEVLQGQSRPGAGWGNSPPEEASRRSVYIHVKRSLLVPILEMHDQADTDSSCPVRYVTTVPTQSLGMLNGEFSNSNAQKLSERLRKESPGDLAAQIRNAVRLTTSRTPTDEEVAKDVAFIKSIQKEDKLTDEQAFKIFCLVTINTNEFIYLD
jgi:hypothetical protein